MNVNKIARLHLLNASYVNGSYYSHVIPALQDAISAYEAAHAAAAARPGIGQQQLQYAEYDLVVAIENDILNRGDQAAFDAGVARARHNEAGDIPAVTWIQEVDFYHHCNSKPLHPSKTIIYETDLYRIIHGTCSRHYGPEYPGGPWDASYESMTIQLK